MLARDFPECFHDGHCPKGHENECCCQCLTQKEERERGQLQRKMFDEDAVTCVGKDNDCQGDSPYCFGIDPRFLTYERKRPGEGVCFEQLCNYNIFN